MEEALKAPSAGRQPIGVSSRLLPAAAFLALVGLGSTTALAQTGPIKVGQFLDLTNGGASAAEAAQFGSDIALREINEAGGIGGRKLQTLPADTQTDATVGVGEMKR